MIGVAVGGILGIFLHRFVITTVEVDACMFCLLYTSEQWVEKSFRKGDRAYRRTDYAKKKSSERVKAGSERTPDRI